MEGSSFCPVRKITARLNRQPAEQETVLARCTSDTRLISRIDKQLQNGDTPKLCQSTRQASKEETQVVNKNSKKCASNNLPTRDMQNKTTLKFCLIPVRLTFIQKSRTKKDERNTSSCLFPHSTSKNRSHAFKKLPDNR